MDKSLFLRVLDVLGFVTTVALPILGVLLWLKFAYLLNSTGGLWARLPPRMALLLLLALISPVLFGWLIGKIMVALG